MKTIWKYPIPITDCFELDMPRGAILLAVQMQHGQPMLWALVEREEPQTQRRFRLVGTGHLIENQANFKHIGTFQLTNGTLVFHLFEEQR